MTTAIYIIDLLKALFELSDSNNSIVSVPDIRGLFHHSLLHFVAIESTRIGCVVLVELPVEVVFVLNHKVLQHPHVTLVDKSVDGNKHICVD